MKMKKIWLLNIQDEFFGMIRNFYFGNLGTATISGFDDNVRKKASSCEISSSDNSSILTIPDF
jgi:hypothetical protein